MFVFSKFATNFKTSTRGLSFHFISAAAAAAGNGAVTAAAAAAGGDGALCAAAAGAGAAAAAAGRVCVLLDSGTVYHVIPIWTEYGGRRK